MTFHHFHLHLTTQNLTIADNVAYNVNGMMFFIEDGNEVHNTFRHNLGVDALPHTLLVPADNDAAIFWITYDNEHFWHII